MKNLNGEILGEQNAENLRVALENFRTTSENFAKTSENLVASSEKISPILDSAKSAVDKAEGSLTQIESAAESANIAIKRATEGPGLIAALMNDSQLRADFAALVSNLRENGVLRYRDTADDSSNPPPSQRKGILRNKKR